MSPVDPSQAVHVPDSNQTCQILDYFLAGPALLVIIIEMILMTGKSKVTKNSQIKGSYDLVDRDISQMVVLPFSP